VKLDRRILSGAGTAYKSLAVTIAIGAADGVAVVFQAWTISRVVSAAFLEGAG